MQIFLLRHGHAGPTPMGGSDRDRALSAEGERQVAAVIARAASRFSDPLILASPYRRAQQSAAIAHRILGCSRAMETCDALTPESNPRAAWQEIRDRQGESDLLLVGHEPLFSALTAYLLGHADLDIVFGTATLACVDVSHFGPVPRGTLHFALPATLA